MSRTATTESLLFNFLNASRLDWAFKNELASAVPLRMRAQKKKNFICGLLSAFLIPVGAFASDALTSPPHKPYCKPMLKIEKVAPPFVKNGAKVQFKIYVRNLNRCKVEGLTVKDFLPKEFLVKQYATSDIAFEAASQKKFTVLKWRNISIRPHDFVVLKFEAKAHVGENFHHNYKRVRNIACVFLQKDKHGSYDDGSFDDLGEQLNHDDELGKALCSAAMIDIVPRSRMTPADWY